jgi:calcineurin-like phosphoesterase family protein
MFFFTSDTHFGHNNIIKYCNRPFSNIDEMGQAIIDRWNSIVKKNDTVFHLGDFCFHNFNRYFYALNGKIILIKGNHDNEAWKNRDKFFEFRDSYYEIKIDNQPITLCHYAMLVWNKSHYGAWHIYGHSHGTLPDNPNSLSFDCGVDTHNFYPYSFDEVKEIMSKKIFVPIDHHKGE